MFHNLSDFIEKLDSMGELYRIKEFVSTELEITEITDRISKAGGKALLFENNGTSFPLLINAFGSEKRICLALGVNNLNEIGLEFEQVFKKLVSSPNSFFDKLKLLPTLNEFASWMPKVLNRKGACQENIFYNPDINMFPILKCWPFDGGKFITLPLVHTIDPITKSRNLGMYRMQVFEKNITGMHWHIHKNSARHFREYKQLGLKMPVAVALGGDPIYTYAATAPLPDNIDEYILAGFLRKRKVELVKCITQDIEVPADADIVIEGYVDPQEEFILEGPFGDHTGYYSLADYYPKFHITCITHKNNAIYPTTIVGIPPQEDAFLGKATERIFLSPIRISLLSEIMDMVMPMEGVFHNLAIVKIKNEYPGHAAKVMNSLWGAGQMMFNKVMIVVDENTDIHNPFAVVKSVARNVNISLDILFSKGPLDVLDHASDVFAYGGKMGVDATKNGRNKIFQIDQIDLQSLKLNYSEISGINDQLIKLNIPILFLTLKKDNSRNVKELAEQLIYEKGFENISYLIFVEQGIDLTDYADIVWSVSNNIDVSRDCFILKSSNTSSTDKLIIDGTIKTYKKNNFARPWPNVVVMDEITINNINRKWDSLHIGPLLTSPSLKYMPVIHGNSAILKK